MRRVAQVLQRIRAEPRPIRFLLSRILWRSGLCRFFLIDLGYARLRFNPTALSATLWADPGRRHADTFFFRSVLRPGDLVVDVGANIGSLTTLAARLVGPSGHVYALEPNPRTYRYLVANLQLDPTGNVTTICAAAGPVNGEADLVHGRSDDQDRIGNEGGTPVRMLTLDSISELHDRSIRLLKIDVEGFERPVLEGAGNILSRTEFVYFESGNALSLRYGYSAIDLIDYLRERRFDVFTVAGTQGLRPLDAAFDAEYLGDLVARATRLRPLSA